MSTISELQRVIIPHFKTYPLHGDKQNAFNILVIVVERLAKGEQFNSQGLADIIQLANLMNKLSQRKSTAYDMIGVLPSQDIPAAKVKLAFSLTSARNL